MSLPGPGRVAEGSDGRDPAERHAGAQGIERGQRTESLLRALDACPPGLDRDQLVEEVVLLNLDLCDRLAGRYTGRGLDHDDLVQVARLALVKAIQRYQPG
ncbi:MAG: hypothetical protein L0H25_06190, partial [Micrococcales bacterium]|nr:hypothetical protein [Micrococcales bacterium]